MIVVSEGDLALRVQPAAQVEIATGYQDQVSRQPPLGVHVTASKDRRLEAVVGSQRVQRGGDGIELGRRGGREQLVRVVFIDRAAGCEIHGQDSPVSMAVV